VGEAGSPSLIPSDMLRKNQRISSLQSHGISSEATSFVGDAPMFGQIYGWETPTPTGSLVFPGIWIAHPIGSSGAQNPAP
jgi:hypothetical protein